MFLVSNIVLIIGCVKKLCKIILIFLKFSKNENVLKWQKIAAKVISKNVTNGSVARGKMKFWKKNWNLKNRPKNKFLRIIKHLLMLKITLKNQRCQQHFSSNKKTGAFKRKLQYDFIWRMTGFFAVFTVLKNRQEQYKFWTEV